jgi:hypothetical protein
MAPHPQSVYGKTNPPPEQIDNMQVKRFGSVSCSPVYRTLREQEGTDGPCAVLQELAAQNYGPSAALPVSLFLSLALIEDLISLNWR